MIPTAVIVLDFPAVIIIIIYIHRENKLVFCLSMCVHMDVKLMDKSITQFVMYHMLLFVCGKIFMW